MMWSLREVLAQPTASKSAPSDEDVTDRYRAAFTSPSETALKHEETDALERAFDLLGIDAHRADHSARPVHRRLGTAMGLLNVSTRSAPPSRS